MIILGIGGILGDAASAILRDGCLAAAVEESKLSRHGLTPGAHTGPTGLPEQSIAACLSLAGVTPEQVDAVAIAKSCYGCKPMIQINLHGMIWLNPLNPCFLSSNLLNF